MRLPRAEAAGLLIIAVSAIALALLAPTNPAGLATHEHYPLFSEPHGASLSDNDLHVTDDAVHKTAYYSVAGEDWQPFTLQGTAYGTSNDWLRGPVSHPLPTSLRGDGEHYIITYSCSLIEDDWDCHGNNDHPGGFWQLLITNNTNGQTLINNIKTTSGKAYEPARLSLNERAYLDRDFLFSDIPPSLEGELFLRTANNDKGYTGDFLTFDLTKDATLYVAMDERNTPPPSWLDKWTKTGHTAAIDEGTTYELYQEEHEAGMVILGGNENYGDNSMYVVIITEEPAEPATGFLADGFETGLKAPFLTITNDGLIETTTAHAHSGMSSLHLRGYGTHHYTRPDSGNDGLVAALNGGETVTLSGYARGDSSAEGYLMLLCLGTTLNYWENGGSTRSTVFTPTDNWEHYSVTATCDPEAVGVGVRVSVRHNGDIWYDDLTISVDGDDCLPATCASLDKECGEWNDGCTGTIDCGSCEEGMTCSDDGECVSCTPEPLAETCGDDCGYHTNNCHQQVYCGSCDTGTERLVVMDNGRYLMKRDSQAPFFYLGDTAWWLLGKLTKEEITTYLDAREAQGFNVIMIMGHAYALEPNKYGHKPYNNDDFTDPRVVTGPDNDYWDLMDFFLDEAEARGMYVAIVPVWGKFYILGERGQKVTASNAYEVGRFYGERYGGREHIVWIMGGDMRPDGYEHVFSLMAEGIIDGSGKSEEDVLLTYHPPGWYEDQGYRHSSSYELHDEAWLDMNGIQSGHYDSDTYPLPNYKYVEHDYLLTPAKPTAEMESLYEDIPFKNNPDNHRGDAYDVRRNAYWSVFAGGYGYTLGNLHIFSFWDPDAGTNNNWYAYEHWEENLYTEASQDLTHLAALMNERPFSTLRPDQELITSSNSDDTNRVQAIRANDGSYAYVYVPNKDARPTVTIDLGRLSGNTLDAKWYDPREGTYGPTSTITNTGTSRTFTLPTTSGQDWVLVIEEE
ncbi:glycoside hydrolase family 140 protein [Candidatus Woesearchaeota archaeon]|nr:glycoside hydrolase family 140 protein [Candidatus Woesearchaeota archaeon]